jgi:hypothetical protein
MAARRFGSARSYDVFDGTTGAAVIRAISADDVAAIPRNATLHRSAAGRSEV